MIKKYIKKIIIIAIIALFVMFLFVADTSKYQFLNSIDYDVKINDDGSISITEIWDMYISHTNTIYKSFDKSDKYGTITNVSVEDMQKGTKLQNQETWSYHAKKDYFYADTNPEESGRPFEIGWGVGLDNSSEKRKYKVSYTVTDVVTQYADCQEFYWQFLARGKNSIPAKVVTGTVTLPKSVSDLENLKVWAHGEVNGEVKRVDNKTVEFKIDELSPLAMVEVRVISKDNVVENANKVNNTNHLYSVETEEAKWSSKTNAQINSSKTTLYIILGIEVLLILVNIMKIKSILKNKNAIPIETHDLKYYRDIPREKDATPAEALYLSKFYKKRLDSEVVQREAVSAIILDLCLKKKIKLTTNEDSTLVEIIDKPDGLKKDELKIYNLLKKASKGNNEFDIKDLSEYARKEYYGYSQSITEMVDATRNSLYDLALIDKVSEKKYVKAEAAAFLGQAIEATYIFSFICLILSKIPFFNMKIACSAGFGIISNLTWFVIAILPYAIVKVVKFRLEDKYLNNISVLTQEGNDEKEQWNGLKNYLNDYSLLKEKDVPELVIWEKYLVYATAFGISGKVIESLKANYPEVFIKESWDDNKQQMYPVINYICNPLYIHHDNVVGTHNPISNLSSSVNKAYHTSITEISRHASSSGSGGGGGFSGGGGGRRRRWPEWVVDKPYNKRRKKMRRKVIAGNWKMNMLPNEAMSFIEKIADKIKDTENEVILCVPYTDLFYSLLTAQGTNIKIGAQNMHYEDNGAYTGEVSAKMLKCIGVEYVIIGHSERRQYYNETDEAVNKKVIKALREGLKPIVCVGETLKQRNFKMTKRIITTQVKKALKGLNTDDVENTIIAYEPIWAIGTGKTATAEQANDAIKAIRDKIRQIYGQNTANKVIIQYGGSVNPSNAKELFEMSDIDGGLVGGASLKVDEFEKIVEYDK